jgi:hypothetical protein
VTKPQALAHDVAREIAHKYRQPIHNAERAEIERGIGSDAVSLHGGEFGEKGDLRSRLVRGRETGAQYNHADYLYLSNRIAFKITMTLLNWWAMAPPIMWR